MKKVYCVTYDYKGPSARYQPLFDELKRFPGWWHYLDRTWLIPSDKNAAAIYERLKPHLDADINLLIIEVGRDRQGWLPKKAWEWIRKHIPLFPLKGK